MSFRVVLIFMLLLVAMFDAAGQCSSLTINQQNEDFKIFKGSLNEGHSGLYYYISKISFEKKADSVQNTFFEGSSCESYYLKLRYLITLLSHGHTRISLPTNGNTNYRMAILESNKVYLPFEFSIIDKKLIVKEDCSKEQLFPKNSVVKSINGISTKHLLASMLKFIPADGNNITFKYYNLSNYFQLHYLFNLQYPGKKGIKIELEGSDVHYYTELLKPKVIDSIYLVKNKKSISQYEKQLLYKADLPSETSYLKIGSFYKGLIEQFGQQYETFLDSAFSDMQDKKIKNLILDLRNNEGGGDSYDLLLLSYLINSPLSADVVVVPGREFNFTKFAINMPDDVKAFIQNPNEFLTNDSSLTLKQEYTGQVIYPVSKKCFNGRILVLINGGTFSASNNVVKRLYNYRKSSKNKVLFIGEETGGDIYSNTECAGQGYVVKLPNSSIVIDMPLLCFGVLNRQYPKKKLPDYEVYDRITDLDARTDNVLKFALKICSKK